MSSRSRGPLGTALETQLAPLREALHAARSGVMPVVGSGLSRPHLPSWSEMLAALVESLPEADRAEMREALGERKYLEVASYVADHAGLPAITKYVKQHFQRPKPERPAIYDALVRLPCDHYLTTNYDPWLQEALFTRSGSRPRVLVPTDTGAFSDIGTGSQPFELMLHGDAARPETCVLTHEDYARLQHEIPAYGAAISALCSQRRLLFVGHSLSDPDLSQHLDAWAAWLSKRAEPQHFALVAGLSKLERSKWQRLRIEPIEYGAAGEHERLADVLTWLAHSEVVEPATAKPSQGEQTRAASRASAKAPRSSFDTALASYRLAAATAFEHTSLLGFGSRIRAPIRLEEIHVPLHAHVDPRGWLAEKHSAAEAEDELAERGTRAIPLIDAWKEAARHGGRRGVAILGDPGSGKTTHLLRALLWTIREGGDSLGLPDESEPVYLPLRDLREADVDLLSFTTRSLRERFPTLAPDFGERLVKERPVLFLLDGLDEIAEEERRASVARWIGAEVAKYPLARFAVTCRYAGYTAGARLSEQFLELHLRPLTREASEQFIERWFRTVESALEPDAQRARTDAEHNARALIELLRSGDLRAPRIVEMTRNPMLLTAVCLVQYDRGSLPRGRTELYRACVEILLERWRSAKAIAGELVPGLDAPNTRRVLQAAAYWMHQEQNRSLATEQELAEALAEPLARLSGGEVAPRDFLRRIRDDSGILTGWSGERYGFLHLGFQEYLAALEIHARAFADRSVLDELARHFGEPWWQEVILLFLALGDPPLFEDFARCLVRQPAFAQHSEVLDLCLEDAARASAQPFLELLEQPAAMDRELWARQREALRVLEKLAPDALSKLAESLAMHPDSAIAKRFRPAAVREEGELETRTLRTGLVAVRIPAGSFLMGSPAHYGDSDEHPQHLVHVSKDFWITTTTVTNAQYAEFLRANPGTREPEYWSDRRYNQERQPVVGVSWEEARQFGAWVGGDLPTEAQWEYACRAGTQTRYSSGDSKSDLEGVGWFAGNSGGSPHAVAEKPANAWGLHDMHGNVWEWCLDGKRTYYAKARIDPVGPASGAWRVVRGGSFWSVADRCRSAVRLGGFPGDRDRDLGFRLAFPAAPEVGV